MGKQAWLIVWSDRYPQHQTFGGNYKQNRAFRQSASCLISHLKKCKIPESNIGVISNPENLELLISEVHAYLDRVASLEKAERVSDFFIYYVGHGEVGHSESWRMFFPFSAENSEISTIAGWEFVETIAKRFTKSDSHKRVFGIIDACYSAHLAEELKKRNAWTAPKEAKGPKPERGLALVCSSSSQKPSSSDSVGECTQFTSALLDALGDGKEPGTKVLEGISAEALLRRIKDHLKENYSNTTRVWPELHSVVNIDGEISEVESFPALRLEGETWEPQRHLLKTIKQRTYSALKILGKTLLWTAIPFSAILLLLLFKGQPLEKFALDLPYISDFVDQFPTEEQLNQKPTVNPEDVCLTIKNDCSFPVQVEIFNLRSARKPDGSIQETGKIRRITFVLPAGVEESSRQFNAKSGPGWYMVFALKKPGFFDRETEWELISLEGEKSGTVNLFRAENSRIRLFVPKDSPQSIRGEIHVY